MSPSSIFFRKAARSELYSEPVDGGGGASEFSYVSILMSRAASSRLRQSSSNSKSVFLLVGVASISKIFFCRFLFSAAAFASSLRRSVISDGFMQVCGSRDP